MEEEGGMGAQPSNLPYFQPSPSGDNVGEEMAYAAQTLRKLWVLESGVQILR